MHRHVHAGDLAVDTGGLFNSPCCASEMYRRCMAFHDLVEIHALHSEAETSPWRRRTTWAACAATGDDDRSPQYPHFIVSVRARFLMVRRMMGI
jgi:hypothetical protein